jgi:hypothetical protein
MSNHDLVGVVLRVVLAVEVVLMATQAVLQLIRLYQPARSRWCRRSYEDASCLQTPAGPQHSCEPDRPDGSQYDKSAGCH